MSEGAGPRIVLAGSGRLARAIARSLPDSIVAVVARDNEAAGEVSRITAGGVTADPKDFFSTGSYDTLWLAVADRALAAMAAEIAALREDWTGVAVLHSSGARPVEILAPFAERGAVPLALHPNASLTGSEPISPRLFWSVTPDSDRAEETASRIIGPLEPVFIRISDQLRPLYHAAATTAANYLVTLFSLATELYRLSGVDEAAARRIVSGFMHAGIGRLQRLEPRDAITGPIARGDHDIVAAQLAAIRGSAPELLEAFAALAALTARWFSMEREEGWRETIRGSGGGER